MCDSLLCERAIGHRANSLFSVSSLNFCHLLFDVYSDNTTECTVNVKIKNARTFALEYACVHIECFCLQTLIRRCRWQQKTRFWLRSNHKVYHETGAYLNPNESRSKWKEYERGIHRILFQPKKVCSRYNSASWCIHWSADSDILTTSAS